MLFFGIRAAPPDSVAIPPFIRNPLPPLPVHTHTQRTTVFSPPSYYGRPFFACLQPSGGRPALMPVHMLDVPASGDRPARRLRLVAAPSSTLLCAACNRLFMDPVILPATGHTFCRGCVSASNKDAPPPVANIAVRLQAAGVLVHCPNGKSNGMGCQETMPLGALEEHLATACLHARAACPNGDACGTMTRVALLCHLSSCQFFRCRFHIFGCDSVEGREWPAV